MQAPGRTRELLIALFLLGVLLLVPPLLTVFNKATRILGIPTLYLYLFAVWAALIGLVAFVVERQYGTDEAAEPGGEASGREPAPPMQGAADA
jgi:hypothetical protein